MTTFLISEGGAIFFLPVGHRSNLCPTIGRHQGGQWDLPSVLLFTWLCSTPRGALNMGQ